MLKLAPAVTEAEWKDLAPGVRVLLKPADAVMLLAGRRAAGEVHKIAADLIAADLAPNGGSVQADAEFAFTVGCLVWGALDWEGVGDQDGEPLPMTEANLTLLLRQSLDIFDKFDREYVVPILVRDAEKNVSSPSLNGTSAAAKTTAVPVPAPAESAPTA
ncbi:hypothetical protein [uncultured Brevundimonas sp.]|uniref:hypothetical protein n=1 Tax=uncultured Brevundimonas sp. TaxID=213418 RepID=UPI0025EAA02B|nr:hypothetical protein [uncultured Brevundimonas sp.]